VDEYYASRTHEANLGQKEAQAEKQQMPISDETKGPNLGQKEAEREKDGLSDEDEEGMAENDEE
jgi:hypothetical protein